MASSQGTDSASSAPTVEGAKSSSVQDCSANASSSETGNDKSDGHLVLDVTKTETCTTTLSVSRDKSGNLRYSVSKRNDFEMTGTVNALPAVRERLIKDSVAPDFIPELNCSSELVKVDARLGKTDKNQGQAMGQTKCNRKKKQMQLVHEESEHKTHQMLRTTSPKVGKASVSGRSGALHSPMASSYEISKQSQAPSGLTGVCISTSMVILPKARHSEIRLVPEPIEYEMMTVKPREHEQESEDINFSPKESFHDALGEAERAADLPSDQMHSAKHSTPDSKLKSNKPLGSMKKTCSIKTKQLEAKHLSTKEVVTAQPKNSDASKLVAASLMSSCKLPQSPSSSFYRRPPGLKNVLIGTPSPPTTKPPTKSPIVAKLHSERSQSKVDSVIAELPVVSGRSKLTPTNDSDSTLTNVSMKKNKDLPLESLGDTKHQNLSSALPKCAEEETSLQKTYVKMSPKCSTKAAEEIDKLHDAPSRIDPHVRFYLNQKNYFATVRDLLDQLVAQDNNGSVKETPVNSKPLQWPAYKEELVKLQQSLLKQEDAFLEQLKASGSMAQFIGLAPMEAPANLQEQPQPPSSE